MPLKTLIPQLYLNNNRENHRSSFGFHKQVFRDPVAHEVSYINPVDRPSGTRSLVYRGYGFLSYFAEQFFGFPQVNKAPRDNVGRAFYLAGLPVYHADNHEDPVFSQVLAVAQHHFTHVAHSQAVHHNIVGGSFGFLYGGLGFTQRKRLAVLHNKYVLFWHAFSLDEFGVVYHHGKLSVYGHKKFGPHKLEHL